MQFTFNTHRCYALDGQIISVKVDRDAQLIYFQDHTRCIRGTISFVSEHQDIISYEIAKLVMANYDIGNYIDNSTNVEMDCHIVMDWRF